MPDPRARDGRTIDRTARLARWLSFLCWVTVLLPVGLGCVFARSGPRWVDTAVPAALASAVLLVVFSVPAVLYRSAAVAVGRRRAWGAAVVLAVAALHAGAAGWALHWMLWGGWRATLTSESPSVLIAELFAVASLALAGAAAGCAYRAIGAVRRLSVTEGPPGFAPVMPTPVVPTPVVPAPPFGERDEPRGSA